jgi:hypothetical protein
MTQAAVGTSDITYSTYGVQRGCCNHVHRTVEDALRCMIEDIYHCKASGCHSDRFVRSTDGHIFGNDWNEEYNQVRLASANFDP